MEVLTVRGWIVKLEMVQHCATLFEIHLGYIEFISADKIRLFRLTALRFEAVQNG
jgi:hypothetical protein